MVQASLKIPAPAPLRVRLSSNAKCGTTWDNGISLGFVWAAVMSRPTEHRAIVDAGLEALAYRLSSFCPLASMAGFG
jgi:D-serine deaminase-like pyridoxal phosphate-dependent protein